MYRELPEYTEYVEISDDRFKPRMNQICDIMLVVAVDLFILIGKGFYYFLKMLFVLIWMSIKWIFTKIDKAIDKALGVIVGFTLKTLFWLTILLMVFNFIINGFSIEKSFSKQGIYKSYSIIK